MLTAQNSKKFKVLQRLFSYIWVQNSGNRRAILLSLLLVGIVMVLDLANPWMIKHIVDGGISKNPHTQSSLLIVMTFLYGFLWTLGHVLLKIKEMFIQSALQKTLHIFSQNLFDHLHSLSIRFHVSKKTGGITSSLSLATQGLSNLFYGTFLFFLPAIFQYGLAFCIFTYSYTWIYGVLMLATAAFYLGITLWSVSWLLKAEQIYVEKEAQVGSYFVDSLLNAEVVKLYHNQKLEHEQFAQKLFERRCAAAISNKRQQIIGIIQTSILGCGLTAILIMTSSNVLKGALTPGDFVLINGCILQCIMPLGYCGIFIHAMRKSLVDLEAIQELFDTKPEIRDMPNAQPLIKRPAQIIFDRVSFGYRRDHTILQEVSFTVQAGNTVGIVGATGCGKSTLSRLLFRLYDVVDGRILINGQDIRTMTQASLHEAIGMVSQDTILFNNTIYYNIVYGKPHAHEAEIRQAIEHAQLTSFIESLPEGYHTLVGERGIKLSGGERQRIALARVILKKPLIYVFDEATSSLDNTTEKEIQKTINAISRDATSLIIAHRLSTLVDVDSIIVLEKGKIIEQGSHHELIFRNGLYESLWSKQL